MTKFQKGWTDVAQEAVDAAKETVQPRTIAINPKPEIAAPPDWSAILPDEYEAITSVNVPGKGWIFVRLTISGFEVTSRIVAEPDMKGLVLERQKIEQAKLWSRCSG